MLAEHLNEVKCVEAQKQHQLVLTLSVVTGSLTKDRNESASQEDIHTNLSVSKNVRNPYLKDFQDLICFLLRHDGIIVEAAELSLKPEGINVSGVKILLFGHHYIACVSQLKRQEHVRLDFWLCQWFPSISNSKSPLC